MSAPDKPERYPLTLKNDAYCIYVARRIFIARRPRNLSFGDLIQAARFGMLKAEQRFDPDRGAKFCTYAHRALVREITRLINDGETTVCISMSTRNRQRRNATDDESYAAALKRVPMVQLDGLAGSRDDHSSDPIDPAQRFPEQLQYTDPEGPYDTELAAGLAPLTERERYVLINRAHGRQLNEIGREFDLSRERIRQIEDQAKKKLKARRHSTMDERRRSEQRILAEILRHFGSKPWCRLWRQNTGRAVPLWAITKRPRPNPLPMIAFGIPGCADLSGLLVPSGRRLEIEVKTETGTQSEQQRRYEAMIRKFGGVYVLARSIDDVYRGLLDHGFDYTRHAA